MKYVVFIRISDAPEMIVELFEVTCGRQISKLADIVVVYLKSKVSW